MCTRSHQNAQKRRSSQESYSTSSFLRIESCLAKSSTKANVLLDNLSAPLYFIIISSYFFYAILCRFLVNAALGSTPLSSPLDSPDVLNTLVPLSDIGIASASIGSIKLPSMDSINLKNQHQPHLQHHHHLHHHSAVSQHQVRLNHFQGNESEYSNIDIGLDKIDKDTMIEDLLRNDDDNMISLKPSGSFENLQRLASILAKRCSNRLSQTTRFSNSYSSQTNSPASYRRNLGGGVNNGMGLPGDSVTSLRSLPLARRSLSTTAHSYSGNISNNNSCNHLCSSGSSLNIPALCSTDHQVGSSCKCLTSIPEAAIETGNDSNYELKALLLRQNGTNSSADKLLFIDSNGHCRLTSANSFQMCPDRHGNVGHLEMQSQSRDCNTKLISEESRKLKVSSNCTSKLVEFSLSSVGRSFIDETHDVRQTLTNFSISTPDTPTPNISPTKSVRQLSRDFDTFSNDFVMNCNSTSSQLQSKVTPKTIPLARFGGSWDLLELDLQFHEVNSDPCYNTDVEERIYHGEGFQLHRNYNEDNNDDDDDEDIQIDDPFGVLPTKPTPPDSLDL